MVLSQIFRKILRSKATTLTKSIIPLFSAGFLALSVVEGLVWILALLLTSCSSTRRVETSPLETIREHQVHDTIVFHNIQHDSVYVISDHYVDRGRDTLLIKDKHIEYRYRLLRDTIFIKQIEIQHDSIPYEIRITETIEVPRKQTWYDHTARATFWLLIGIIFFWLYRKVPKP